MENMEDFCVSHNYTQRDLLLPPSCCSLHPAFLFLLHLLLHLLLHHHPPPSSINVYTLFFRIEMNHPGIIVC
jgi:hypothetical protein